MNPRYIDPDGTRARVDRVKDRVPCPYCGVKAGELCVNQLNEPLTYKVHSKRVMDYVNKMWPIHLNINDAGGGP